MLQTARRNVSIHANANLEARVMNSNVIGLLWSILLVMWESFYGRRCMYIFDTKYKIWLNGDGKFAELLFST